ncbi:serpin family protein [Candidatus Omnitrophota bacterium]
MRYRNIHTVFLILLLILFRPSTCVYAETDVTKLVRDNTTFAVDLYQKLCTSEGNIIYSPYSISSVLAVTSAGARGNTEKQMKKALCLSLDQKRLHPTFAGLRATINSIQKSGEVSLSLANSLWPQKDYTFLKTYLSLVKQNYGVSITPVDYKHNREAARRTINRWVEDETQQKIRNLIQPGILDSLTKLVLVNAIYFKGNWDNPFNANLTRDKPFFLPSGKQIQAPMMYRKNSFRYAEFDSLQVLELPYAGNQLSMIVLLPREKDGLKQLEQSLSVKNLENWKNNNKKRETLVYLPKFSMTIEFRLKQMLKSLGMTDAFGLKANFSGMSHELPGLLIKAVIHKAFVDVNEEGTEAVAATAVVMRPKANPLQQKPTPVFRADHPFLFLICEQQTGSILFMGRVTDPTKKG